MTEMVNATIAMSSLASFSGIGWLVTLITFCSIFLVMFIIFRNFRRTIYGAVVTGSLLIVYKISRWFGVSTEKGNYIPITWFGYIISFIILSWIIGIILDKTKIIKKIERKK